MRSALLDDDVVAFLEERGRRTAIEFHKHLPAEPPLLAWGEQAEYRPVTADGTPRIFVVQSVADWWRIRYQIAHEVFHWLCTPPDTFHWTHELLAVEVAVRAMDELGEEDYARRERERLARDAEQLPLEAMLATQLGRNPNPAGLYGRAWTTGRELIGAVGWEHVKRLADCFDDGGKPDPPGWLRSLPAAERARAEAVLGSPA